MKTTNATVQSVPGCWKKWWSAFIKFFKGGGTGACASGQTANCKRGATHGKRKQRDLMGLGEVKLAMPSLVVCFG